MDHVYLQFLTALQLIRLLYSQEVELCIFACMYVLSKLPVCKILMVLLAIQLVSILCKHSHQWMLISTGGWNMHCKYAELFPCHCHIHWWGYCNSCITTSCYCSCRTAPKCGWMPHCKHQCRKQCRNVLAHWIYTWYVNYHISSIWYCCCWATNYSSLVFVLQNIQGGHLHGFVDL